MRNEEVLYIIRYRGVLFNYNIDISDRRIFLQHACKTFDIVYLVLILFIATL